MQHCDHCTDNPLEPSKLVPKIALGTQVLKRTKNRREVLQAVTSGPPKDETRSPNTKASTPDRER
ncbi:hypothetical protein CONPUDRAFT_84592 [Coniophora puteana RWD-64-598 SS2]|uniref:Uncharacterized protein n=1 Tax=Coniophora puteana (strain RWD-64-598) TaxID=741705 RepID=A0A5M3MC38_CONPW|nr:uncharacterized protein CONPUDRAFT_84592 [Coniophora puteana RWD-64-598 SS2]EIW76617.1 hypothetical protein CONPUDRAFT_84592 [Coniophora puteana RWD-64-598 SS2]